MKHKERIKRVFSKITILQRIKNIWQRIKKFFLERFLVFAEVMSIVFFIVIFISLIVRGFYDDSLYFFDKLMGTDGESNAKYQTLRSLALLLAGLGGLLGLFISKRIKKFFLELSFVNGLVIVVLLVILFFIFMRGYGDESHVLDDWLGTDEESNAKYRTLRLLALLLAGMVGFFISNRRAKAMEDQAKAMEYQAGVQTKSVEEQAKSVKEQVEDNRNKTFHEAIKHLGDSSFSVRLGNIYTLYDLARLNPEKYLKNIIEILSAHVRETTQKKEYRKEYEKQPSNEISSLLKLLSNLNTKYLSENEEAKSSPLDLSNTYLCGVRLFQADFRKVVFIHSNFEGAALWKSHFEGANLVGSHFEGAELIRSHFAGANFPKSHFESAKLKGSHFEGAELWESHFEGADLEGSHFEGADLEGSHFEGADLEGSHFEGADLEGSHFEGADLEGSHFEGANLEGSHFESVYLHVSHFEGANLFRAHFEGADLEGSHFEGADLRNSHFEGADLIKSNFAGAYDDQDESIGDFKKRIENRKGKKAEIGKTMIFAGGIKEDDIKALKKITEDTLPHFTDDDKRKEFKERMEKAIEELKPHQGQDVSYKIPEHLKGSIFLGELTKEKADEIIQRYKDVIKKCYEIKKKI